jgi:putative membrane protein
MTSERLHPLGVVIIAGRRLRRLGQFALPALGAVVFGVVPLGIVVAAGVVLAAAALVLGALEWWRFTFGVEEGALVVRHGILQHDVITVPLPRIQALDISQGAIPRLIGVREVRVRVAGGTPGVRLVAVSAAAEARLRTALGDPGVPAAEDVVRRLTPGELPLIGLTSPFILAGLAALYGVLNRLDEVLPGDLTGAAEHAVEPHHLASWLLAAAVVVVAIVVGSVAGAVLSYAGFSVIRDGPRLRVRRGLLQRHEVVLPIERVRSVVLLQNPPREMLGRAVIRARTAMRGSSQDTVLFPLMRVREAPEFIGSVLPALRLEGIPVYKPPPRALARAVRRTTWPWLALSALAIWFIRPWGTAALVLVPLAAVLGWARFRACGVGLTDRRFTMTRRRYGRRRLVADARAVQWRTVRASPFQRRRGLVSFQAGLVTGGTAEALDLDEIDAGTLARALDPRRVRA